MNFFNFLNKSNKQLENITFIFGCPRSGTTWLWSLLESHKDVYPFLLNYEKLNGKYASSESGVYVKDPKHAKNRIERIVKKYPNKIIIEKTPIHTLKNREIRRDFPNAKFLIIFRNPIAIVNSMLNSEMKAFEHFDYRRSVETVKSYYSQMISLYNSDKTFYVTYEKLYNQTPIELNHIFSFLNLSDENLDKIIDTNRGYTKVNVKGAYRKAEPVSYLKELSIDIVEKTQSDLNEEILFFNNL